MDSAVPAQAGPAGTALPGAAAAGCDPSSERVASLARSLCALLLERTPLDKALLVPTNVGIALIARETVGWLNWDAWDAQLSALAAERAEALAAERLVAEEEQAAAEAEAVADGKEPPAKKPAAVSKEEAAAADALDVPSSLAAQLVEDAELAPRFVTWLLQEALIRPHPVTRINTALLLDAPSRRLAFALLQVACQHRPVTLKRVLAWVGQMHGRTRTEQLQLASVTEPTEEDEWNIDPAVSQRSSTGFVGLKNQAATCYQNSFLQLLFNVPSFRHALLRVREPGWDASDAPSDAAADSDDDEEKSELTLLSHVQSIFYYLSNSRRRSFDPLLFVKSFKGWDGQPLDPKVQQDVSEFCGMLFDRLEGNLERVAREAGIEAAQAVALPSASGSNAQSSRSSTNLVKHFFGGSLQNEMICSEYPAAGDAHKRVNQEAFQLLTLGVKNSRSLEGALDSYVEGETLEGVTCPACHAKRATRKRAVVHTWPRITIFHLKRFEFDYATLRTVKLNDELTFPLEIDLEPWTAQGVERREAEKAKAEAAAAEHAAEEAEEHKEAAEEEKAAEEQAEHTLTDLDPLIYFPCAKCNRAAVVQCEECKCKYCPTHESEAHAVSSEADAESASAAAAVAPASATPAPAPSTPTQLYRLVGVLVHAGHAEGGHYYSYILGSTGKWHEFNDQDISDFNPERLAAECFGGMEPPEGVPGAVGPDGIAAAAADGFEIVGASSGKGGKNKRKRQGKGIDDEWQTGLVEKHRNAYLLWYERVDAAEAAAATAESGVSSPTSVDSLASSVDALSLSSVSAASGTSSSPLSAAPSSLPAHLRAMHTRIARENAQQLQDEMLFEKAYHDALFRIARDNIEWIPPQQQADGSSSSSSAPDARLSSSKYLDDISSLDTSDLFVQYLQYFALFVLETYARSAESSRMDQWCILLQHGFAQHVGCCQWLLERFVLEPQLLSSILLACPLESTRKSVANLLELVVKKLIRFEIDEEFVDALHIMLPSLKPIQKRVDAQAGLAAALGAEAAGGSAASVVSPVGVSSKSSALPPSSSSASLLSSALVQSASVEAQHAPEGLFKPSAKSTVSVSAKLAVIEGVGKATEKQFNSVGIKTLQNLVEITPKQRELIAAGPAGGMTQALLEQLVDKANKCVEFILELSGVNATLEQERKAKAERDAAKRKQAGSEFVGPRLLPAFVRTCLQTLAEVEHGSGSHCAPELCELLANLAQCGVGMLRLLIEQGTVQMCIKLIASPAVFKAEMQAKNKHNRALKRKAAAAAGEVAESDDSKEPSRSAAESASSPTADEDFHQAAAIAAAADVEKTDAERVEEAEMIAAIAAVEEAEAAARASANGEQGGKAGRNKSKRGRKKSTSEAGAAAAASPASAAAVAAAPTPAAAASKPNSSPALSKKVSESKSTGSLSRQSSTSSRAGSSTFDDDDSDSDDEDEDSPLNDLSQVEVVHLLDVLVRACTSPSGKVNKPVEPLPASLGPTLPEDTWEQLREAPFLSRLVLQVSSKKPDPPSHLVGHLVWENHDMTDRVVEAIFASMKEVDFYDFYAGVKLLQSMLLTLKDSVSEYRVELCMPRMVKEAVEQKQYYKACELLIKAFMHLVQHAPLVTNWARQHVNELQWMEHWLGKNKHMPEIKRSGADAPAADGKPEPSVVEGQAKFVLKFGATKGVNASWEKAWDEQFESYGIGLAASDSVSDYQKIFKKMLLNLRVRNSKA